MQSAWIEKKYLSLDGRRAEANEMKFAFELLVHAHDIFQLLDALNPLRTIGQQINVPSVLPDRAKIGKKMKIGQKQKRIRTAQT